MRRLDISPGAAFVLSVALHAAAGVAIDRVLGPGGGAAGRSIPAASLHATLIDPALPATPGDATLAEVIGSGEDAGAGNGIGLFDFPYPLYFGVRDLDHKPAIIGKVVLVYPEDAPLVQHGQVFLELFIDETGRVDKVLVDAPGTPETLQELARDRFAQALFRPGIRKDQLVKSRLRIEVVFEGRR